MLGPAHFSQNFFIGHHPAPCRQKPVPLGHPVLHLPAPTGTPESSRRRAGAESSLRHLYRTTLHRQGNSCRLLRLYKLSNISVIRSNSSGIVFDFDPPAVPLFLSDFGPKQPVISTNRLEIRIAALARKVFLFLLPLMFHVEPRVRYSSNEPTLRYCGPITVRRSLFC